MRWVVIAAIIVAVVVNVLVTPESDRHPPLNPRVFGTPWYEAHPDLTALGAGAIVLVVGSIVVAVVNARRRG
jgi:hypothetical protein